MNPIHLFVIIISSALLVSSQVLTPFFNNALPTAPTQLANNVASLNNLQLSTQAGVPITFATQFASSQFTYNFKLTPDVTGVFLFPTASNNLAKTVATIATTGTTMLIINGGPSQMIPLMAPFPLQVALTVTSADGTTTATYTVNFSFQPVVKNFFQIKTLVFSDPATGAMFPLTPPFNPTVFQYTVTIPATASTQSMINMNLALVSPTAIGFFSTNMNFVNPTTPAPLGNAAMVTIPISPSGPIQGHQQIVLSLRDPINEPGQTFSDNIIQIVHAPAAGTGLNLQVLNANNCALDGSCASDNTIQPANIGLIAGSLTGAIAGGFILGYTLMYFVTKKDTTNVIIKK